MPQTNTLHWVLMKHGFPALHKAGYITIDTLADVNPNKLRQELCEMNKKYKLELQNPTAEEVEAWISGAAK